MAVTAQVVPEQLRLFHVNAHGFFPPRDMKHYHRVEKTMQARCLFHVNDQAMS
jgi:hypothetical protein